MIRFWKEHDRNLVASPKDSFWRANTNKIYANYTCLNDVVGQVWPLKKDKYLHMKMSWFEKRKVYVNKAIEAQVGIGGPLGYLLFYGIHIRKFGKKAGL